MVEHVWLMVGRWLRNVWQGIVIGYRDRWHRTSGMFGIGWLPDGYADGWRCSVSDGCRKAGGDGWNHVEVYG
jgi:alanine racemase